MTTMTKQSTSWALRLLATVLLSQYALAFAPQRAIRTIRTKSHWKPTTPALVVAPPPQSSTTSLQAMGSLAASTISVLRAGAAAASRKNLALVASGGAGDVAGIVGSAYDWCINLGAPSALVAGAVVATIYENVGSGDLDVLPKDPRWIQVGKRVTRVLLLSAFALEVLSIFVTTVTGTMLLERTLDHMDEIVPVTEGTTPLQFLRDNFEFEYLTARITFLQGLLNWLGAIALGHIVPNTAEDGSITESPGARRMNNFIGSFLLTTAAIIIAFYNKHMTFYRNYGCMLGRWLAVLAKRYIFNGYGFRPMALVYLPSIVATMYYGFQAFRDDHPDDDIESSKTGDNDNVAGPESNNKSNSE